MQWHSKKSPGISLDSKWIILVSSGILSIGPLMSSKDSLTLRSANSNVEMLLRCRGVFLDSGVGIGVTKPADAVVLVTNIQQMLQV